MQVITNLDQLNALPPSPLRNHLTDKYNDLVETEDDLPPIFIIVEPKDNLSGPDFAFVSDNGLLGDEGDSNPYESIAPLPELGVLELLCLLNGEDGYWIYITTSTVKGNPALARLLNSSTLR
jgi:hypothetical protein